MAAFHIVAIVALFFYSWKALLIAIVLWWVTGRLGIGMGYHRLLTHRSIQNAQVDRVFSDLLRHADSRRRTDILGRDAPHSSSVHRPGRGPTLSARRKMVVAYGLDSYWEIHASRHDHARALCP